MTFRPYTLLHNLDSGVHTRGINVVSFSGCGNFLACGSDDRSVTVWSVKNGDLLHKLITRSPVLSLVWHPQRNDFFFGCQNGALNLIHFEPLNISKAHEVLSGTEAPVESLDIEAKSGFLAIGVGSEVEIAKQLSEHVYSTFILMPSPSPPGLRPHGADDRIRPRSVHFLPGGWKLIVSYLNHGIVCWDVMTQARLWTMTPSHYSLHVGSSSLSPDFRHILVYNLCDGLDLYKLRSKNMQQSYRFTADADVNYPLKVAFTNNGQSVVCGAQDGQVRVWNRITGMQEQILAHGDHLIQGICTHQTDHCALIAITASNTVDHCPIAIWQAPIDSQTPLKKLTSWLTSMMMIIYEDYITTTDFKQNWNVVVIAALSVLVLILTKYVDFAYVFQETMYRVKMMVSAIQAAFINAFFTTYSRLKEFLYYQWITFKPKLQNALREFLRE